MKLSEGFLIGFRAIGINKMRSLLTMLGIIVGVASVLAMIAVGDGAKTIVLQDADKLGGASQFSMWRGGWIKKKGQWVRNRSSEFLKYDDVVAIEAECPSVELVIPRIPRWGGILVQAADGAESRTGYNGVDSHFPIGMNWEVGRGRFFTETEFSDRQKVCVIGSELATELFGDDEPIGKQIKVARSADWEIRREERERVMVRFTVVGVMETRGRSLRFGWNLDNILFVPLTTAQERFTGNDHVTMFTVKAKHIDLIDKAQEEVKAVMRKQHRNQDDFFHIWVLNESMEQLHKISWVIKITLGSIAGFSLLVGGIGIMNMMLVSVTERTREIGLRKAIGAKRRDILFQFLVEAITMCSVGGLLGVGLGIGASYGMANIAVKIVKVVPEWPAVISMQWMVISVTFSAAIGIIFGVYPAVKAAQLLPVEALRTE